MTFRALLAVCGCLLCAAASHAGSISITTRQNAHYDAGNLVLNVTIGNTGDEAAQAVTPILRFGGKEARGKRVESLSPNQTVQDTVTLPVGELTSGTWIYLVAVDYTDTNQYPFQAVQGGRVAIVHQRSHGPGPDAQIRKGRGQTLYERFLPGHGHPERGRSGL